VLNAAIDQMKRSAEAIEALVRGLDDEEARWRPEPGKWSMLDVIAHLVDEEKLDFRVRIDLTLRHPDREWPPIDPEGWVVEHDYASKSLPEVVAQFRRERDASLVWLRNLSAPDWNASHDHPQMGPVTAGSLLGAWVAHDLLHIGQIARIRYARNAAVSEPHPVEYAGPGPS